MFLRLSLLIVVLAILSKESFGAAPTKAPISTPTVAPSRGPTRTPTAPPTAKPSVKPSLRPSAAPTFPAPTAKPTANPTPTPTTATPSVTPTKWPTVVPTAIPTASPSVDPTADPTLAPTADPTVLPSAAPTAEPTLIPTAIPSAEPTIPHPSASPTIRPSANPTLTFAPTVAPTRQMTPIVSWVTNVTLDAVAQPQLDLDCQKTVMATIATFLNLPTTALTYLGSGPATVVPTRRLQQAGEPATYYHFTVSMRVQINLAQTSYTTAFALYNASAPALEHAVHFGAFDQLIQSNAVSMGTPDLERASSYQVFDSPYAVANPDFSKDENLDLTEGGVAIIVICCLVMFFVILYMAWNSTQKHAPPPGVEHATPKGYAVAEDDDENTTINKL